MIEHDGKSGSLFKTTWLSKVDVGYRVAPPQTKEPLTPTYIYIYINIIGAAHNRVCNKSMVLPPGRQMDRT